MIQYTAEQAVIRQLVDWRKAGASLRTIAQRLNDQGVLTREGKHWNPMGVKRVIDRDVALA